MTRFPLVAIVVLGLALAGPASAGAAEVWFADGFDRGVPSELADGWGWSLAASGHHGPGLRTVMPKGEHWGASGHIDMREIGAGTVDTLFWRYWLRLDSDFHVAPPNRGKLPGPAGLYTYNCLGGRVSTPAEPCWSARTMFSRTYPRWGEPGYPNGPDDVTQLGSYIYHLDGPSNRGEIVLWDDAAAQLDHGRWYCVEGRVSMNTPGVRDGVLQAWVDGRSAYDRRDLRFRRSSESGIHVKSFWMDVYHGGGTSAADNGVWLDSLALGPQRLGCDDTTPLNGRFADDDRSKHEDDIEWLAGQGITSGCSSDGRRFCPGEVVTRGQMAAFLTRALGLPAATRAFDDTAGHRFASAIGALAGRGITTGCVRDGSRFCPDDPVTRGQMAAFLVRAYGLPAGPQSFRDVVGSTFASDIGALRAAGVTTGCSSDGTRFCPDKPVTRAQMASFLRRAATR